jgi:hypothetical protein
MYAWYVGRPEGLVDEREFEISLRSDQPEDTVF